MLLKMCLENIRNDRAKNTKKSERKMIGSVNQDEEVIGLHNN